MKARIYHNPRCSKSRATLGILEEQGVEHEVINYLDTPPSKNALKTILKQLGKEPQEIIRFGESVAKELGISKSDKRTKEEWIALMVAHPILIERPIVVVGEKAALGRPPEQVLSII